MLQLDRTIESLIALIDMIYKQRSVVGEIISNFMGISLNDMMDGDLGTFPGEYLEPDHISYHFWSQQCKHKT